MHIWITTLAVIRRVFHPLNAKMLFGTIVIIAAHTALQLWLYHTSRQAARAKHCQRRKLSALLTLLRLFSHSETFSAYLSQTRGQDDGGSIGGIVSVSFRGKNVQKAARSVDYVLGNTSCLHPWRCFLRDAVYVSVRCDCRQGRALFPHFPYERRYSFSTSGGNLLSNGALPSFFQLRQARYALQHLLSSAVLECLRGVFAFL